MGNVVKQTLALAELPSPENFPITETSFGAESLEDGVYSITTTTRYNAAGPRIISSPGFWSGKRFRLSAGSVSIILLMRQLKIDALYVLEG